VEFKNLKCLDLCTFGERIAQGSLALIISVRNKSKVWWWQLVRI